MGFKFNGEMFSRTFIKLSAGPKIGEFLKAFGDDNIKRCIFENKYITDLIPDNYKNELKAKFPPQYKEMIDGFTNQEVYGWVPKEYREIIQSCPNWKAWVRDQLDAIRTFLKS
ncbi:MAG: hypothetical protein PHU23_14645 [Dehalococcoidales bacterium]|nr:hypothetical protein [Dehalococcoidales bacterium]